MYVHIYIYIYQKLVTSADKPMTYMSELNYLRTRSTLQAPSFAPCWVTICSSGSERFLQDQSPDAEPDQSEDDSGLDMANMGNHGKLKAP